MLEVSRLRWTVLVGTMLLAAATVASATPLACGDECTIDSNSAGYLPPVVEIQSGTSVVWTSQDITHIQAETALAGTGDPCFVQPAQPGSPSEAVRFDLVGASLLATVGEDTRACTNAVVAGGVAVLNYHCTLHPNMRGVLVVTTA